MFDFIRKHTRIALFVLVLLVIPSFVLFGLEGYTRMGDKGQAVAVVDGRDITQIEWDNAHKQEVDRIRAQMPGIDLKLLDSPQARYTTLERLVRERVLTVAAEKSRLTATDQRLARELQQDPTIASLRKPDGTLDLERYKQLLSAQGMSPEMFEAGLRSDISRRQVLAGVAQSALSGNAMADSALGALQERREVQVARFAAADFKAKVALTDADIEAFHKANGTLFQSPEQAGIEYLVFDLDAVRRNLTVNDADLRTYYEQNLARLAGTEERRASHILINAPKSASADERAKAKARAEQLLAQVRAKPDSFADVARKNSQDPGSAAQGGDLDFFRRGAMVKPLEDAAFALKKGDISALVETEFGYHIIRLTDIKAPKTRSFEEMKPELEQEVKKQQAQRKFAEQAEAFTNGVYEQSDSLKPTAEKLKLEIRTATVLRNAAPGTPGPLANPKFLTALFAADAIQNKRNTEAVEVGPNQLVAGRIVQHQPARTRPLDEVKAQAREALLAQRAAEAARKEGNDKLAAWKAAPAQAALPAATTVSRQMSGGLPPKVIEAALRADPSALPGWVGVDLGNEGFAVVRVNKVLPREAAGAADPVAQQLRAQYQQAWTGAEAQAYYNLLKERYKVRIQVSQPKEEAAPKL